MNDGSQALTMKQREEQIELDQVILRLDLNLNPNLEVKAGVLVPPSQRLTDLLRQSRLQCGPALALQQSEFLFLDVRETIPLYFSEVTAVSFDLVDPVA